MIRNVLELSQTHGKAARIVLSALEYAIGRVDPALLVKHSVKYAKNTKSTITIAGIKGEKISLKDFENVYAVGAGKAAAKMADCLSEILGSRLTLGAITVPYDDTTEIRKEFKSLVSVTRAAHPVPDRSGVQGAKRILEVVSKATSEDVIFVLISGGGSSLLPLPRPGLTLQDKQKITGLLLHSGAAIHEVNVVRKHLSAIKGGQLLRHVNNARVVALVLSDVIGDDMSSIASGPTFPDSSTFADAQMILEKYSLANSSSSAVKYIGSGVNGRVHETLKPGDPIFARTHNVLIGNNEAACRAAGTYLHRRGIKTSYLGSRFAGEAAAFGKYLAKLALDLKAGVQEYDALILGGETTVTIRRGKAGKGGRNQEAALSCASSIPQGVIAACIGTDGIDGNSDAAGALVSNVVPITARRQRESLRGHLACHNSYPLLKSAGSLIFTGRTGTNVNDIAIVYTPH